MSSTQKKIEFSAPKDNYTITGELTLTAPGTYMAEGKLFTLHSGSIKVRLNEGEIDIEGRVNIKLGFTKKELT